MATILQILNADPNLRLFNNGVMTTELEQKLAETGPFTILGPVNLAMRSLQPLSYEQLMEPANAAKLFDVLAEYILVGKKMIHDFRHDQKIPTLNGKQVTVTIKNGSTYINDSKILAHNRQGSNGVIHLMDKSFSVSES